MKIDVFVENEAGSRIKHLYNEDTFEFITSKEVSLPYPFPYGFITRTKSGDGDNLDCYVVTERVFSSGQIIQCVPFALMEQYEDGDEDFNILAYPNDENEPVLDEIIMAKLTDFVSHVFDNIPGKKVVSGKFTGKAEAEKYIENAKDWLSNPLTL